MRLNPGPMDVQRTYAVLGIEHILTRFDHLLKMPVAAFLVARPRIEVLTPHIILTRATIYNEC